MVGWLVGKAVPHSNCEIKWISLSSRAKITLTRWLRRKSSSRLVHFISIEMTWLTQQKSVKIGAFIFLLTRSFSFNSPAPSPYSSMNHLLFCTYHFISSECQVWHCPWCQICPNMSTISVRSKRRRGISTSRWWQLRWRWQILRKKFHQIWWWKQWKVWCGFCWPYQHKQCWGFLGHIRWQICHQIR